MAKRPGSCVLLALALAACGQGRETTPAFNGSPRDDLEGRPVAEALTRRVWDGGAGRPSPDGRTLAFTDWETGDIALHDLATGADRRLTGNVRWSDSLGFGEFAVFSNDGRTVAHTWTLADRSELRVVGVDGSGQRTVFRAPPGGWLEPHAWSPSDEWILGALHGDDGSTTLALVSVEEGEVRRLRSFGWRSPLSMAFSPDGRFVAFDLPASDRDPARDVLVLSLAGEGESVVASGEGDERLLGWAPDGSVYYRSGQGELATVWRVSVHDGTPRGPAEGVRADLWRLSPLGFAEGALFYSIAVGQPQVLTADLMAGGAAVPLAGPAAERGLSPAWSPEGTRIAYVSGPAGRGPLDLVIRAEDGEARRVPLPLQYLFRVLWAPDGETLFVSARSQGRRGLWRVELASAGARLLTPTGSGAAFQPSPDGRTLYYTDEDDGGRGIVARDLETGAERVVTPLRPARENLALSTDGRELAFTTREGSSYRLWRVAVAGGEPALVHRLPDELLVGWSALQWSRDGRELLLATGSPGGGWTVSAIAVDGGETRPLFGHDGLVWALRLHPDGRRIAFQSGTDRAETWVMERLGGGGVFPPPGEG